MANLFRCGGKKISYSTEKVTLSGNVYFRDLDLTQFEDWENITQVAVLGFEILGSITTSASTNGGGTLYLNLDEHTKGNSTLKITALPSTGGWQSSANAWSIKLLLIRE